MSLAHPLMTGNVGFRFARLQVGDEVTRMSTGWLGAYLTKDYHTASAYFAAVIAVNRFKLFRFRMSQQNNKSRTEQDSMGEIQVPAEAYYGAQTQRAVENFPVSGWTMPEPMISAMGRVKLACGIANRDLKKLTETGKTPLTDPQVESMLAACQEVIEGKLNDQFPIDVFQTGSGTSSNMNINEVISLSLIHI